MCRAAGLDMICIIEVQSRACTALRPCCRYKPFVKLRYGRDFSQVCHSLPGLGCPAAMCHLTRRPPGYLHPLMMALWWMHRMPRIRAHGRSWTADESDTPC